MLDVLKRLQSGYDYVSSLDSEQAYLDALNREDVTTYKLAICKTAVKYDHFKIFRQYATIKVLKFAIDYKRDKFVKYLSVTPVKNMSSCMRMIVEFCSLDIVKFYMSQGFELPRKVMFCRGGLDNTKAKIMFLFAAGCEFNDVDYRAEDIVYSFYYNNEYYLAYKLLNSIDAPQFDKGIKKFLFDKYDIYQKPLKFTTDIIFYFK